MSWRWLAIGAVLALTGRVDADAPPRLGHVAFRSYGADDGLTALDVVAGTQDRDGFIWAASPSGLFRFDGARFRRFSTEDGLPSPLVTDLAVGPDGVLWGATSRGLFRQQRERFVGLGTDILPVDGMHLLGFDADGRTWITTTAGPFTEVAPDRFELAAGWPGGEAYGLLVEPDGTMLVGHGRRLLRHPPRGLGYDDVGHDFGATITALQRDGAGRLWIRAGQHLWMQPRADARFEDRSDLGGAQSGPTNVRLALSARGTLLVPTANGLVELDGGRPRLLATDLPADARSIKAVWLDREGSLWLTSLGLHHELGRGRWRTITVADGLPSNNVWSVTGLHDGRLAVGTDGGVALLGAHGIARITDRTVVATLEQPAGVLWIATTELQRYDLATGELRTIGPASGLTEGAPTSLAAEPDGTVWVGIDRGGLYRIAPATAPRVERVTLPGGDGARVWSLAVDGDRLWVTTSRGLVVRADGGWHLFTHADGLRDDGLTFITVRRDHTVCVSYLAPLGATCLGYAAGHLTDLHDIDEAAGLTSPMPYFLDEDLAGRLWVGGAHGVDVLDQQGVDHFTRGGGAPGDDCNAGASWIAPTGEVWIGTSSGLGVFDGAGYRPAPPPVVALERGLLGRQPLDLTAGRTVDRPTVPYQHGDLDVEFAALTFLDPRQLEYQVKLIGFDEDWRASESHDAHYRRLPAGSYRFAVRARQRGGLWGEPTTFGFVVATPWWRTWWFRTLAVLGVVGVGVVVVGWRSRHLIARNLELEALVRDRTHELVEANQRMAQSEKLSALGRLLAQLSHEINNPLNVVHNNLGPLEEYAQTLATAVETCRDLADQPGARAAIDELWARLDLQYVIDDSGPAFASMRHAITRIAAIHAELRTFLRGVPPERELIDLGASVRVTAQMFARSLPDVEIRCDLPPLPAVLVHAGRINQTVTNLLQNAADAMGRRGQIHLTAEVDATHLHLRVADTGPGVPPAVRPRIFEPFFTTKDVGCGLGLGLSICREIVVAHGGTLDVDDGYRGGACFVISLPRPATSRLPVRLAA